MNKQHDAAAVRVFPPAVALSRPHRHRSITLADRLGVPASENLEILVWRSNHSRRFLLSGVLVGCSLSPERPKRKPMEAYASAARPRTFSNHAKSNVPSDDPDLPWGGYHSGKRLDSGDDAILRVGASTIRDPSGRGLPGTQVRRAVPCL